MLQPVVEPSTLAQFPGAATGFAKWTPVHFKFTNCYYVKKISEDGASRWEFARPDNIDKQAKPTSLFVSQPSTNMSVRRFEDGDLESDIASEEISKRTDIPP